MTDGDRVRDGGARPWMGVVIALVALSAAALIWLLTRPVAPAAPAAAIAVVRAGADDSPAAPAVAPAAAVALPPDMLRALRLPASAHLKDLPAVAGTGSIVCGEVSRGDGDASYRRFVYNRVGNTGAVDDGTDLFRRFADKICRQH